MIHNQPELVNFPLADQAIVKAIVDNNLPGQNVELFIFGSRSLTHKCKAYSDLDLVIRAETAIPRHILFKIEESLENSILTYRVDLLDWHRISDEFKNEIADKLIEIALK